MATPIISPKLIIPDRDNIDVPKHLECPLCLCIFNQPVVDACGHTYDYECIRTQLRRDQRCPESRQTLRLSDLRNNLLARAGVESFLAERGIAATEAEPEPEPEPSAPAPFAQPRVAQLAPQPTVAQLAPQPTVSVTVRRQTSSAELNFDDVPSELIEIIARYPNYRTNYWAAKLLYQQLRMQLDEMQVPRRYQRDMFPRIWGRNLPFPRPWRDTDSWHFYYPPTEDDRKKWENLPRYILIDRKYDKRRQEIPPTFEKRLDDEFYKFAESYPTPKQLLIEALKRCHYNLIMRALIMIKAKSIRDDVYDPFRAYDLTGLHLAVLYCDAIVVQWLLEDRYPTNAIPVAGYLSSSSPCTPLELAKALLNTEHDINARVRLTGIIDTFERFASNKQKACTMM